MTTVPPTTLPKYTLQTFYGNLSTPTIYPAGEAHLAYIRYCLEGLNPYIVNSVYEILIQVNTGNSSIRTFIKTPQMAIHIPPTNTIGGFDDYWALSCVTGLFRNDTVNTTLQAGSCSREYLTPNTGVNYDNIDDVYDYLLNSGSVSPGQIFFYRNVPGSSPLTNVNTSSSNVADIVDKFYNFTKGLEEIMEEHPEDFAKNGINLMRLYYYIRAEALPKSVLQT